MQLESWGTADDRDTQASSAFRMHNQILLYIDFDSDHLALTEEAEAVRAESIIGSVATATEHGTICFNTDSPNSFEHRRCVAISNVRTFHTKG